MASCYEHVWGGRTCPAGLIIVGAPFSSENYIFLAAVAYLLYHSRTVWAVPLVRGCAPRAWGVCGAGAPRAAPSPVFCLRRHAVLLPFLLDLEAVTLLARSVLQLLREI